MSPDQARRQGGLTLIELILFIVIISVAVVGVLQVMSLTTKSSADPVRRKQALMIAEALLEEVQLAKFTFCDPTSPDAETATSRAACAVPEDYGQKAPEPAGARPFDNVNDYVDTPGVPAYPFNHASGRLADINNDEMGLDGYTASVTIAPEDLGGIAATGPNGPEVLRITVQVTYDGGKAVALDAYRTRYDPNFL